MEDIVDPGSRPKIRQFWLEQAEQTGVLQLANPQGAPRKVRYSAKPDILPMRHLFVFCDRPAGEVVADEQLSPAVEDYALYLLNADGVVAAWYSGAERLYGYTRRDALGQHVSVLLSAEEHALTEARMELNRSAAEGQFGSEGWHVRLDGSRFWANAITMALRDCFGSA